MKLKTISPETQAMHREFADRLTKWMNDAGLKQSDLARKIWGTTKDKRGYEVARNRDRISSYLAGVGLPEPENLQKLADALGCEPGDLVGPANVTRPLTRARSPQVDIQLATVIGRRGLMQIEIKMVLKTKDAMVLAQTAEDMQAAMAEEEETESET
jgi:hypothetical protein